MLMILEYYVQTIKKEKSYTINKTLEELRTWFILTKLSKSIEKNYMIFPNKRIDKSDIFIKIDQKLIKQVIIVS